MSNNNDKPLPFEATGTGRTRVTLLGGMTHYDVGELRTIAAGSGWVQFTTRTGERWSVPSSSVLAIVRDPSGTHATSKPGSHEGQHPDCTVCEAMQ